MLYITNFGQVKNNVGQVKIMNYLPAWLVSSENYVGGA